MQTITVNPGLLVDLWPQGVDSDPAPAVHIRRADGSGVVVYLPEVKGLLHALAAAASETAMRAVQGARE